MTRRLITGVLLVLALAALPWPAAAQSACETALRNASDLFTQGRFDGARQAALSCLDASPSRAERSRTLALVAKIALAQDDVAGAEGFVSRLLAADPEFQPDLFDTPR